MNKRDFIKKHEKKLALAFLYFWDKQRKKLKDKDIEELKLKGYFDEEVEDDYKKLLDGFFLPFLLLSLEEGEKNIIENFTPLFNLSTEVKIKVVGEEVKKRAKYFYNEQNEALGSILKDSILTDDELVNEIIKSSVGLSKKDTQALLNYNEALKKGESSATIRKKQIIRYSRKKRRERARAVGRTETAQGYSKMGRIAIKKAQKKYNWTVFKTWITSNDSRVCPICRNLAGITIDIDDFFPAYGGIIGPEESHTRCRCDLRYTIID